MLKIMLLWLVHTLAELSVSGMLLPSGPYDRLKFAAANPVTLSKGKGCFGHAWGYELADICIAILSWKVVGNPSFPTVL